MAVKDNGTKKPFWKKWWFWTLIVVLVIGCVIEATEPETEGDIAAITEETTGSAATKESKTLETTEPTATKELETERTEQAVETETSIEIEESQTGETLSDKEKFIENIQEAIKGQVGENEFIMDVTLENEDLHIGVDFSKVDPTPLTMKDLAILRTASITEKILEFSEYDDLWQTIIIDFKDLGYIKNDKQDIKDGEYGRYFSEENFKLEFDTDIEVQEENEQTTIENTIRGAIEKVITEEMLETFNYVPSNNFSLIKFKGSENVTNNMTIKGMYLDIFSILKAIQPIIDTDVDFNITYPLIDQYGNTEDVIVIKATFTNDTIKKINFESAIWEDIPVMADNWWNHSAVNINE